jgi:Xaa-Pro aminopeptidase
MTKLKKLKKLFKAFKIDGYIVPKNDEFFGEYIPENKDNLKYISNFSGSYGFALLLKKKNYLFVDGRYTLQAKIQSGKTFKIINIPKEFPSDILKKQKLNIGFDPKLHTEFMMQYFFKRSNCKLVPISQNLVNMIWVRKNINKSNLFYKLSDKDAGKSSEKKIKKLISVINNNKVDFQFISSPENVAWLLNLRGLDSEFVPIPNSYLIVSNKSKVSFFCDLKKIDQKLKEDLINIEIIDIKNIEIFLSKLKGKIFQLDNNSCSFFFKNFIKKNNVII